MLTARHKRTGSWLVVAVLLLAAVPAAHGGETAPAEQPPVWSGSVGLSLVATSGNSDTQTVGSELQLERRPLPWGLKVAASFTRAEQDGTTTAERSAAGIRGERTLSKRWSLFAGANGERDQLAGLDLRSIAEAGATYTVATGPTHTVAIDSGLTWTREDLVSQDKSNDFLGGLLGLSWAWQLSATASLKERLIWFPNLDVSSNWRATSETALQANVSTRLALKLSYLLRYDHEPVPGFEDTDTTTTMSLVLSF